MGGPPRFARFLIAQAWLIGRDDCRPTSIDEARPLPELPGTPAATVLGCAPRSPISGELVCGDSIRRLTYELVRTEEPVPNEDVPAGRVGGAGEVRAGGIRFVALLENAA